MGAMAAGIHLSYAASIQPAAFDHDKCVCGLPIIRAKGREAEMGWYHHTGERGCRAALFNVDQDAWAGSGRDLKGKARPAKR